MFLKVTVKFVLLMRVSLYIMVLNTIPKIKFRLDFLKIVVAWKNIVVVMEKHRCCHGKTLLLSWIFWFKLGIFCF